MIQAEDEEKLIPAGETRDRISTGRALAAGTTATGLEQERRNISPLAKDIARREGIDLSGFPSGATGRKNRQEDVLRLLQRKETADPKQKGATKSRPRRR